MKAQPLMLLSAIMLAGCSSFRVPTDLEGNLPAKGSVIPTTNLKLTPTLSVPLDKLVYLGGYVAVAYLIIDPLAPNWEIQQAAFPDSQYSLSLQMKRYYSGGAGEARVVFHRRAKELMREGGYESYRVLEYTEGMESSVLGAQRVAEGVIQLTGKNG